MNEADNTGPMGEESLLAGLADEFMARLKRGEPPPLEEYTARYPALAREIAELLSTLQAVGAAQAEAGPGAGGVEPGLENRTLGDFRIIREIGRGGMGTVYEAEQLSLGRRVALKVLPLAGLLDPRLLRRFKNEAQAAAQLHHNHIVPVHAVGCDRGVHYYAMAYIEGASLAEVIAELRRSEPGTAGAPAGEPRSTSRLACQLTAGPPAATSGAANGAVSGKHSGTRRREFFRSVARLGLEAAEALGHAHQAGVIHRDIKPSNLMLDQRGQLWVTDFGLAHYRSGQTGTLTLPGDFLGTVRYMSPEQAGGQAVLLDQRTDLYSLGATLYELICLRAAFGSADRQEVLRQIAEREPPPPRRWNPAVPVDLETIVLKAMAKEPGGRYGSAGELAVDLRRFLAGEPIQARRPGPGPRVWRWTQRHWAAAGVGAGVLLLVSVGSGLSAWRIARERTAVVAQRDAAVSEQERADANYQLAVRMLEGAVLEVLEQRLPRQGRLEARDQQLLAEALAFYEGFLKQNRDLAGVRQDVGAAYQRVGKIRQGLGQMPEAEEAYRQSIAVLERLAGKGPGQGAGRFQLSGALREYGQLLNEAGRHWEAEAIGRRAVAASVTIAGGRAEDRVGLCGSEAVLGRALRSLGRLEEAQAAHEAQLRVARDWAAQSPREPQALWILGESCRDLALVEQERGAWAEAEGYYRQARESYGVLREAAPGEPRYQAALAQALAGLGEVMRAQGHLAPAEEMIKNGIAMQIALVEEYPAWPDLKLALVEMGCLQERILLDLGSMREADKRIPDLLIYAQSLPEKVRMKLAYHRVMASLHGTLSLILAKLDRPGEAMRSRGRCLDHQALLLLLNEDPRLRDPKRAVELAQQAATLAPGNGQVLLTLALAHFRAGQWPQAQATAEAALKTRLESQCLAWLILAKARHALGHLPDATDAYFHAVSQVRRPEEERLRQEVAAALGPHVQANPPSTGGISQAIAESSAPANNPDQGRPEGHLVACWPFEETDTDRVQDASGHQRHGKFVGGARIIRDPERGAVLKLGPGLGEYVDCGNDPAFNLVSGFTIAAWIKTQLFENFYQAVITKGNSAWRLHRFEPMQSLCLSLEGARTTSHAYGEVAGQTAVDDGQWHHVAAVFDGHHLSLYLDGRLEDRAVVFAGTLQKSDAPVWIGNTYGASYNRFFVGLIDDVRIYSIPLLRNEVEAIYSGKDRPSPPKPAGLEQVNPRLRTPNP